MNEKDLGSHVSPHASRPHLSVVTDDPKRLTRAEVAKRLGVSVSTVRRYEGDRLHPDVGDDGVRYFLASEVERLARTLVDTREASPRARERAVERAAELTRGELAALVFERLEQRHSLAEIVIALRVPPEDVRAMYREWLLGLWESELRQKEPRVPPMHTLAGYERRVKVADLDALLSALPDGEETRISVARQCEDWEDDQYMFRNLAELGGFVVDGPIDASAIAGRYGEGTYRVTAFAIDPPVLRWEVFVSCEAPRASSSEPKATKTTTAAPDPSPTDASPASCSTASPAVPIATETATAPPELAAAPTASAPSAPIEAAKPPAATSVTEPPEAAPVAPLASAPNDETSVDPHAWATQMAALASPTAPAIAATATAGAAPNADVWKAFRAAATAKRPASRAAASPRAKPISDAQVRATMEEAAKRLPPVPALVMRVLLENAGAVELQFLRTLVETSGGQVEPLVATFRLRAVGEAMLGTIAAAVGEPIASIVDRWESPEPWTPPADLEEQIARALANTRSR